MTAAASWLGLPLAFLVTSAAAGLLAERVARAALPDGLLAPLGAWVAVLLVLPVYLLDAGSAVAAPVLLALTAAGLWVGRRDLRRPLRGPAAPAALAAYVLYLAPVLLSGHWTWTGYNFVNDPSINFVMVDHLAHLGAGPATGGPSTAVSAVNGTLSASYPLGIHSLLATFDRLVPGPLPAIYQPFIACLAGLAAMALAELARLCRLPAAAAGAAAVVAVGASLTYNYGLHGAFKELALVGCVATAAAIARVALDARLHAGTVALAAVALAAGIAIISSVAGGYAVVLAGLLVVSAAALEPARVGRGTIGRAALAGAGVLVVAIAPFLKAAIVFGRTASSQFSTGNVDPTAFFAHLVRPLPLYQALGTWLRDDYRYPLEPGILRTLTTVVLVLTGAIVAAGVVAETRRRRWGAVLALVPALAVYLVTAPRLAPYGEAKLLVVLSPMLVFTAAIGAWWLSRRAWVLGAAAAVLLAAGVLGSDAMTYHFTRLAPIPRLEALQDAADHSAGGRWLFPEWEEFAKYYGRGIALDVAPESFSPAPAQLRRPGPLFARSFDLDQLTLPYVERWDGLLLRRSPVASRPPANFRLAYANADYALWRREARPRVLEHLPLGDPQRRAAVPSCAAVTELGRRAGSGQALVAAAAPAMPTLDPTRPPLRPTSWGISPTPGVVIPNGPGLVRQTLDFAPGTYRAWIRGSAERPLTVSVDARVVGRASGVDTPGQWLRAGTVSVRGGPQAVTLFRAGGGLGPGNGYRGEIGRLVFEPTRAPAIVTVPPGDARSLCGRAWDWIERVQP